MKPKSNRSGSIRRDGDDVMISGFVQRDEDKDGNFLSLSLDDAREIAKGITDAFGEGADAEMRHTKKMLEFLHNKEFTKSIAMGEYLVLEFPENRAKYEMSMGAAYFFLGQYEKAIELYLEAGDHSDDQTMHSMMDDNVWEALEILYKESGDVKYLERYLSYFPEGQHAEEVKKRF